MRFKKASVLVQAAEDITLTKDEVDTATLVKGDSHQLLLEDGRVVEPAGKNKWKVVTASARVAIDYETENSRRDADLEEVVKGIDPSYEVEQSSVGMITFFCDKSKSTELKAAADSLDFDVRTWETDHSFALEAYES